MITDFGISKSTVMFKIDMVKLIGKYPKLKYLLLSLHFMKNYFKLIKEICEENDSEFKYVTKNQFKFD